MPDKNFLIKGLIYLIILFYFSCSSSGFKISDRREGFRKGKLRVYVRDDMSDIEDDDNFKKKAEKKLVKVSNDRAVHLIISYIRYTVDDPGKYGIFNDRILKIVEKGKVMHGSCNDNFCERFTDYETEKLKIDIDKMKTKGPVEKTDTKTGTKNNNTK